MKSLIIFFTGAAVGGLVGYVVSRVIYDKKLSETRNAYAELNPISIKEEPDTNDISNPPTMATVLGYAPEVNFAPAPSEPPEEDEPYYIDPARFEGDPVYAKEYLTYVVADDDIYGPGDVLYEVWDEKEEQSFAPDPLELFGEEFLTDATDPNGADIFYIRNEKLKRDFEVEVIRGA